MKKAIYYFSMVVLWFLILLFIGSILVWIGVIPLMYNFRFSLGAACGHPQLWLVSAGIVMLLRPVLYRSILEEEREFNPHVGIAVIVIGVIWLLMTLLPKLIR